MTTITGNGIPFAQLVATRGAVKLEALGMRASRNYNATEVCKKRFGITTRGAKGRAEVLARLEKEIELARAALQPGDIV